MAFVAIPDSDLEVDDFLTIGLMRQFRDNDDALNEVGTRMYSGTVIATTSGTAHNFTGIPAGTKLIVISFFATSFTVDDTALLLQIGDGGVIETSGYVCHRGTITSTAASIVSSTTSFDLILIGSGGVGAAKGSVVLSLLNSSTNLWAMSGSMTNNTGIATYISGTKALTATLDIIRISGGTFDAGSVNILYQ